MRGKSILTVVVTGAVAFLCGVFFSRPSQGQDKDQKPAQTAVSRFQLVPLPRTNFFGVIDTTNGHTWARQYHESTSSWGNWEDLGIPSEKVKEK